MFRHKRNYFGDIPCPSSRINEECRTVNCIFKHDGAMENSTLSKNDRNIRAGLKRNRDADEQGPGKKVKGVNEGTKGEYEEGAIAYNAPTENEGAKLKDISFIIPTAVSHIEISRAERTINCKKLLKLYQEKAAKTPNRKAVEEEYALAIASKSREEYSQKVESILNVKTQNAVKDPNFILPREVLPSAPAILSERKKFVQILADAVRKTDPDSEAPITRAIDEEFQVASKTTNNTYVQSIKRRIYEITNFKTPDRQPRHISDKEYLEKLKEIVIPIDVLAKYGYITAVPEEKEINQTRTCTRCKAEFRLQDHLRQVQCNYHWGKMNKVGKGNRVYECCGAAVGGDADPCATSDFHVFQWSDASERHSALPYKTTAELYGSKNHAFKALGIDCEMGFTTKGFELLRITAMDFFSREEVLDVLVRPKGTVIDLNTKWSGIAEIRDEALAFEDSINLLGEVMDKNTILIGHGLENDLNSMRLIHHRVVDTAIIYPKHKTSPTFRFALKYLTFKYLGRTIQTGEHDSSEDSLAAIDIVKYFIRLDIK